MLAVISHPDCLLHDAGAHHPERPERLHAIDDQIIMSGLEQVIGRYDAPLVTREQLIRVHAPAYVDRIFALAPKNGYVEIDGDTVMSPGTLAAAQRAAGAGVMGADLIMKRAAGPIFCAVRPPGHHAERDRAMGFCLFNNVAIAAAHVLAEHGLNRVAIVDFDVHRGNGTEDIFRNDPRVLYCSSYQHPFYPHTEHNSHAPNVIEARLAAGMDGQAFRKIIAECWFPALNEFRPEILLISAGFDAHVADDMSGLNLIEADFGWLTSELVSIANAHCEGRILSMLEGGYELGALGRSVVSHLKALLD